MATRPAPTSPRGYRMSDGKLTTPTRGAGTKMGRYKGTGKDPEGRYGLGVVVDIQDHEHGTAGRNESELSLLEKGWIEPLDPKEDAGRTDAQIAAAVQRGDALTDPVDREIAEEKGYIDPYGGPTDAALDAVHEDPQPDADAIPSASSGMLSRPLNEGGDASVSDELREEGAEGAEARSQEEGKTETPAADGDGSGSAEGESSDATTGDADASTDAGEAGDAKPKTGRGGRARS